MIRTYIKIAWRNLTRNKAYTFINIFGLAIGICSCLVIYLITSYELSYDTFHPDKDRIYRIIGTITDKTGKVSMTAATPDPTPMALREEIPGFETTAAFHNYDVNTIITNEKNETKKFEPVNGEMIVTEPAYFNIFHYKWLAGDKETALKEPHTVVLSEKKAIKYFGANSPEKFLGKTLVYQDSLQVTVTGIVKDWEQNTDLRFTDFISFSTFNTASNEFMTNHLNKEWNDFWSASQAFVKLREGTTASSFDKQFKAFAKKHYDAGFPFVPALQPLSELHFNEKMQDNYSRKAHLPTLYALMGIALFILILAVINFINLSTAQSVQRAKEIGVRKVLGSSRRSLIIQFLGEALILTLIAILVSMLLATPVMNAFRSFIPEGITFDFTDPRILLFLVVLTGITTLLSGFYPAWLLSSHKPVITLKGQATHPGERKSILRKGLVVFQFSISLVFIIGTLIISKQMEFIRTKDMGFTSDAVIILNLPREKTGNLKKVFAEKIRQLPGIADLAFQYEGPMHEGNMNDKIVYKGKNIIETDVESNYTDDRFIPLYNIKMIAGRNMQKSDSLKEIVINETFSKILGFKNPSDAINNFIVYREKSYSIVGVTADFHQASFHSSIRPAIVVFAPWVNNVAIKVPTGTDLKKTLASVENIYKSVYPEQKLQYRFYDESIAKLYEKETQTAQLMNTATLITIFISCIGLFGLATFTARQRTKEIGIRKVLGATVS